MRDRDVIEIFDGLRIEVMVSSQTSNNTCCVFVETTPPGKGPPPHKHLREEEVFVPLEGDYEFYRDGDWIPMEVGVAMISLRDTWHAFRNVGAGDGRMMLTTNGGGIDEFFRAVSELRMPDDAARLDEIGARHGYYFRPPS